MTAVKQATNVVTDFAKGFVAGANGDRVTTAQAVGDVVGALIPGVGELKAIADVWEGAKNKDPARVVGGLIGLIPIAGDIAKVGGKGAQIAGKEIAKSGVKKGTVKLSEMALKSAKAAAKNPELQKRATQATTVAAEHAGKMALAKLVDKLGEMQAKGQSPEVMARQHKGFIEARDAAFTGMDAKPNKNWSDLTSEGENGQRTLVGRHHDGDVGFRILAPNAEEQPLRLYWWRGGQGETDKMAFGIEECPASKGEVDIIMKKYLERDQTFRPRSTT